jgi:hypothetical protein
MQLLYDCSLRRSSIDFNRQTSGNTAAIRVFEFQLLNQEYCLGRIFDNIHVGTEKIYSPLDTFVKIPNGGGKENAFYNYMICLNFIINKAQFEINRFPKEISQFPGEDWKWQKAEFTHSDYKNQIISNNYFYKGFAEKRGVEADLKYILANNCVKVIHKIMAVLLTGFNVFVDFQDDLRSQEIKWGTLDPTNFVIMIGRLPTKKVSIPNPPKNASNPSENAPSSSSSSTSSKPPENASSSSTSSKPSENASITSRITNIFKKGDSSNSKTDDSSNSKTSNSSSNAPADAPVDVPANAPTDAPANPQPMPSQQNWLKVTANYEHEIIGYYEQNKDGTYTKINDTIKLKKDGENWIFSKNNTETVINKEGEQYFITDNANKKISIKFEDTGAPYLPGSADIQSDNIDYYDLPPNYSINGVSYTVVGTIYKSIHHDYYYNYYDHEHNTLLSDCNAKYNVQAMNIDSFTVNKEMFPFIRLYKKNGFVPPLKKDLIYQDVITQIKSGQI